jgi:hypothetical protein
MTTASAIELGRPAAARRQIAMALLAGWPARLGVHLGDCLCGAVYRRVFRFRRLSGVLPFRPVMSAPRHPGLTASSGFPVADMIVRFRSPRRLPRDSTESLLSVEPCGPITVGSMAAFGATASSPVAPAIGGSCRRLFGCQRVGCDRISLRRASLGRKIASTDWESGKSLPCSSAGCAFPAPGATLAAIFCAHAVKRHRSRRTQTGGNHEIVTSLPRRRRRARARRADPDPIGTRPIG